MSRRTLRIAMLLLAGCVPTVEQDPVVTTSGATIAIFAPNAADPCAGKLPFPAGLAKNLVTGTLDIPYCPTDTPDETAIKTGLRTLDGYSLNTPIYAELSGPVDVSTIDDGVVLIDVGTHLQVPHITSFDPTTNRLYIIQAAPLRERATYIVALTTDIKDVNGNNIVSDQVFTFLKSQGSLIDSAGYSRFSALSNDEAYALEPLRAAYANIFGEVAVLGYDRSEILVAWHFSTQTVHASLPVLAGTVSASIPAVSYQGTLRAAEHPLLAAAGVPFNNLCNLHSGTITVTGLLTDSGTFGAGANGVPLTNSTTIDYLLATPNLGSDCSQRWAADPTEAWDYAKVVVFVHGLGRCKNDMLAVANTFAQVGFATLSLDGPRAGSRSVGALGDQDLDGCQDQPATPELVTLLGQNPNPFAIRDHLREWALELVQVAQAATDEPWSFAGQPDPATGPAEVSVVGHSFGGMAGVLAASVSSDIQLLVVTATSGGLGNMFAPLLVAQGQSDAVPIFGWAMEPGDPLYAVSSFPTPSSLPVMVQVVTNNGVAPDASLHAGATQRALATAFNRAPVANTTFSMICDDAGTPRAFCDSDSAVVGAMLAPCVDDSASPDFPLGYNRLVEMQTQIATFLVSGGALPPAAPAPTPACP